MPQCDGGLAAGKIQVDGLLNNKPVNVDTVVFMKERLGKYMTESVLMVLPGAPGRQIFLKMAGQGYSFARIFRLPGADQNIHSRLIKVD